MHDLLFVIAGLLYPASGAAVWLTTRPRAPALARPVARVLSIAAIGVHIGALIDRGMDAGRLPIQNQYESMTGVALFAAIGGLAIAWRSGTRRVSENPTSPHPSSSTTSSPRTGTAAVIAGFIAASLILIAAHDLPVPGREVEPEAPILSTASLLKFHVTTVIAGYGLSAVGGLLAIAWIARPAARDTLSRPLALASRLTFWVLGVGVLLGAWWAHGAWGRWWAFDAKETWALITWLAYFLPVHAAAIKGDRAAAPTVAVCNLLGMLVMLWSYFGVNLLLISLHSYA